MNNNRRKAKGDDEAAATASVDTTSTDQGGADRAMQADKVREAKDTAGEPPVDQAVRNHLGRKLKQSYDELVRQPVPDKFRRLLEELERQEKKQ